MNAEYNSLAGEAYSVVRQRIMRGELPIGQVISRRKIANELGMSFLPVSEALLKLEFEGLLESRPRAGTRVRIPTRQDVKGNYVIREALEVHAARVFSEVATEDERNELLKLAARIDAVASQKASNRFLYPTLHAKLHRRIAECTRCPGLPEAIERTHALAAAWLYVGDPPQNRSEKRLNRHFKLMQVLTGDKPEVAAQAMREHLTGSLQKTLDRLEPFFRLRKVQGGVYSRSGKPLQLAVPA